MNIPGVVQFSLDSQGDHWKMTVEQRLECDKGLNVPTGRL